MTKRCLVLGLAVLFLCLAPGCSSGSVQEAANTKQVTDYVKSDAAPRQGGVLRLALSGSKTLNPILAENQNNLSVFKLIYDGLFSLRNNGALEHVLCENYSISPDGLTYDFQIKDGVSFHNGARLTAADVSATLSLLLATENLYQSKLSVISGHGAQGQRLTVTLQKPVINFPALLDFPVLSQGDIGAGYDPLTYVPNGTGRYKVQSYKKSKELYLSVNENYHKTFAPYIAEIKVMLLKNDSVAISALENLQIDLLSSDTLNLSEYTPKRNVSSVEYDSGKFTFVGLNNQKPALLSGKTRFALSAALDKNAILSSCNISYAEAAEVPLPNGSFWNNSLPAESALEPTAVLSMLAEDAWEDTDGNNILDKEVHGERVDLSLEILVNSENSTRMRVAEQVKTMWLTAGIRAFVTAVPFAEYQKKIQEKSYDVFIGSVDFTENYDFSFLLRTDENLCGVAIEHIDQTLNALALMDDEGRKQTLYHELCSVLRSEMPMIGLYFEHDVLIFDGRIQGDITPSASDIFMDIEKWFLD